MNKAEIKKLTEIITATAELLGRELSAMAIVIYVRAVEDLDFQDVSAAFSRMVQTKRFFPPPAELREEVLGPPTLIEDKAQSECAKVWQAIKHHGGYQTVQFDDPTTMAVISQGFGGWEKLCTEASLDEEKWQRKEFVKLFVAYARTGLTFNGPLYGITDRMNGARGYALQAPALVGDPRKCAQLLADSRETTLDGPADPDRNLPKLLANIGRRLDS